MSAPTSDQQPLAPHTPAPPHAPARQSAPPAGQPQKPQRSRFVVDLGRGTHGAPATGSPRRGGRKVLKITGLVLLALLLGLTVGGYFYWQSYKTRPAYSLALLVDAVERDDAAAFNELIDTDKVAESFAPQITEQAAARVGGALTPFLRKQIEGAVPRLMPKIKQSIRGEIVKGVRAIGARAAGKPFFLVALAVPYVVSVTQDGDTAKAAAQIEGRNVELTMQRNGERWKIVGARDDALAARIVEQVAKDLPSARGQIEEEIRRRAKENLPGLPTNSLPDIMNGGSDQQLGRNPRR